MTFTISHGINEGNVTAQVLPFIATDAAGNSNIASSLHEITIDRIVPTVTAASVINTGIIRLDVSETVFDRSAAPVDFVIAGVESIPTVTSIAVSGSTITLTLSSLITDADNPMVSYTRDAGSIEDLATNPLADFAGQIATNDIDTTPPTVVISSEQVDDGGITDSDPVTLIATFSEPLTAGTFTTSDVTAEGNVAHNVISVDLRSERVYHIMIEHDVEDPNIAVSIAADTSSLT